MDGDDVAYYDDNVIRIIMVTANISRIIIAIVFGRFGSGPSLLDAMGLAIGEGAPVDQAVFHRYHPNSRLHR